MKSIGRELKINVCCRWVRGVRLFLLSLTILLILSGPAVLADILEVGEGKQYSSIQLAVDDAEDGDTIEVSAGDYNENEPVSVDNELDLKCIDPGECRIRNFVQFGANSEGSVFQGFFVYPSSPPSDGERHFVLSINAKMTVDNVTIDSGTNDYVDLYNNHYSITGVQINADEVEVKNCLITRMSYFGLKINATRAYIHDNIIRSQYADSIRITPVTDDANANLIMDNELGESYTSDGVQTNGSDYGSSDKPGEKLDNDFNMIIGNRIYGNAENAIDLKGANHTWVEGNLLQGTQGDNDGQADNTTEDYGTSAISCGTNAKVMHSVIINNIVYDNNGGIGGQGDYFRFGNNTCLGNNRNFDGPNQDGDHSSRIGISPAWYSHGVIINNLIGGNNSGELQLCDLSDVVVDYNFYTNDIQKPLFVIKKGENAEVYNDFNSWRDKAVPGQEINSMVGDPRFVSVDSKPVGDDYHFADFDVIPESPVVDRARYNTQVNGNGKGRKMPVDDPYWFRGGNDNPNAPLVKIYVRNDSGEGFEALIEEVKYDEGILYLNKKDYEWEDDAKVYLCPKGKCFSGDAPDIGAIDQNSDSD